MVRVCVILGCIVVAACGRGPSESTEVDANLFLLRALEGSYQRAPLGESNRTTVVDWLERTKERSSQLRASIRADRLDADLGRLYDEHLAFIGIYEAYLSNLDRIEEEAGTRSTVDALRVLGSALDAGDRAESRALQRGNTRDGATVSALGSALFAGSAEFIERGAERKRWQEQAAGAEAERLREAWRVALANARETAATLTKRYAWRLGEAGFDDYQGTSLDDYRKRRPRDPFVLVEHAAQPGDGASPEELIERARLSESAVELVPVGGAYDAFRADFLREASRLSLRAINVELIPFSYSLGPTPSASEAVRLCRLYAAANRSDASKTAELWLAHALAADGLYQDAAKVSETVRDVWEHDPSFRYRQVKLLSLIGELDRAHEWLRYAYQAGFNEIDFVRSDADLANYRENRPEQFAEMTTVKWDGKLQWDIYLNDVVLTNESPFDLTNVRMEIDIRQGSQHWEYVIRRDLIRAGEATREENLFHIPEDRFDESKVVFHSDQSQ